MLISCGKNSGTITEQMVSASFSQIYHCIRLERDTSFLASLYKCFGDALRIVGGPNVLTPEVQTGIIQATGEHLNIMSEKRKARAGRPASELGDDKEDLMLIEEMEDFALEDMVKVLVQFDQNHPLVFAVGSVRDLGLHLDRWESGDEGGNEG